jgi:hypothetical protein
MNPWIFTPAFILFHADIFASSEPGHGGIAGPAILTTVVIWNSGVVQDVIMDESSGSEALVGMEETGPVVEI